MIASSNYDEFAVSPEVDKRFFWWLSHSPYFTETVRSSAFGVVIEKMVFNRETWLEKKIPLPLLAEQRRIVARIEELAAKVEEACRLRGQATGDASGLLLSELHRRFVTEENTWPRSTVSQCAEIIDPNPSHRMPRYAEAGYPFISTVDFVGSEEIRRRTAKYVAEETYLEQKSRCSFAAGDVLYSRIGTIGQARLLTEVWPFALSHVLVVVKPKLGIEPRFLLWYLRSDSIISQADEATRSIGVPDLGIKRIREFHMPRPSIDEQRRIVAELDALQMQVDSLQDLQAETSAELDALMPSILDKAFRGKL
jgi:type I restriction enzyme S subunit